MALQDIFTIMATSFLFAFIVEGLSYLLVFNTDGYKKLTSESKRLQNKVDNLKSKEPTKTNGRKAKAAEDDAQNVNKQLASYKMKSDLFFGAFQLVTFSIMSSMYIFLWDAEVVAKLPFEPFSLLRGITHRGLSGSDWTDCAYLFIHILGSMVFRSNLQKLFGTVPPKQASFFQPMKTE